MEIKTLIQIVTGIMGALAIWVVGRKKPWYKWGYIIGLVSQPFWLITYLMYGQYYLLWPLVLYTWAWYTGFKNHFKGQVFTFLGKKVYYVKELG